MLTKSRSSLKKNENKTLTKNERLISSFRFFNGA